MKRNEVYIGNNIDVLKTFPDNSVDSIVTDPPYEVSCEISDTKRWSVS